MNWSVILILISFQAMATSPGVGISLKLERDTRNLSNDPNSRVFCMACNGQVYPCSYERYVEEEKIGDKAAQENACKRMGKTSSKIEADCQDSDSKECDNS